MERAGGTQAGGLGLAAPLPGGLCSEDRCPTLSEQVPLSLAALAAQGSGSPLGLLQAAGLQGSAGLLSGPQLRGREMRGTEGWVQEGKAGTEGWASSSPLPPPC